MQTIGVIGGLGPQATMDFEQRVHRVAQRLNPEQPRQSYPPLVVYYHRRPPVVSDDGMMPTFPIRVDPLLLEAARRLGAWADFLVITSNGVHMFQPEIEQASGRKVVSMIDATVAEVKQRGLRRVGVLGLFEPRVYYAPLAQIGVQYETIDGDLQKRLDQAIFAVTEGRAHETYDIGREVIAALRDREVQSIILGCTEIPFMLPDAESDPTLINPIQHLAEAAVRAAIG
jgi:aspartate racemase